MTKFTKQELIEAIERLDPCPRGFSLFKSDLKVWDPVYLVRKYRKSDGSSRRSFRRAMCLMWLLDEVGYKMQRVRNQKLGQLKYTTTTPLTKQLRKMSAERLIATVVKYSKYRLQPE